MEKCKEIIESDCSNSRDLKGDVALEPSAVSCVSDKIKIDLLDKTIEDRNCNITLIKNKEKLGLDRKQSELSPGKDKPNVIGLHVGPNGLINGLEIENSAHLSHFLENIPKSETHDSMCTPSSSHFTQKSACEINSLNSLCRPIRTNGRTEEESCKKVDSATHCGATAKGSSQSLDSFSPHVSKETTDDFGVEYVSYVSELQMPDIMRLIQKDLSEPYSIYTYRYFIHNWPKLCYLAMVETKCVGAIVCKLDIHRKVVKRGYIAMLAVDEKYRNRRIGSNLVLKAIRAMVADDADEVVLETEITNSSALRLYERLGFVRDKRLFRYYLNGVDALRLKLWLR